MAIHENCPQIEKRRELTEDCKVCEYRGRCSTGDIDVEDLEYYNGREKVDSFIDEVDKDNGR